MKRADTNYRNYPHRVTIRAHAGTVHLEVFDWIEDNIGEYYINWNFTGYDFMFKSEKDATIFALRWA